MLRFLDEFEGHPHLYQRDRIKIKPTEENTGKAQLWGKNKYLKHMDGTHVDVVHCELPFPPH